MSKFKSSSGLDLVLFLFLPRSRSSKFMPIKCESVDPVLLDLELGLFFYCLYLGMNKNFNALKSHLLKNLTEKLNVRRTTQVKIRQSKKSLFPIC